MNYTYKKAILSYCLKGSKNTEGKNTKVVRTKNRWIMLLSKCSVCNIKKLKFHKEQNARWLLSSLGIRTPLSKFSLLGYFFVLKV